MKPPPSRAWLSLHVFLSDPQGGERYLRECLAPALERWRAGHLVDGWFFIRYWEGGPHFRIRLAGPIVRDEARAIAELSAGIATFCAAQPPSRHDYYRDHAFDGQPVVAGDLPWYAEGTVVPIAYQPEIPRYGGVHAIGASEQLFELSSRLALSVCKASGASQSARLSAAFMLMATAVLACGEDLDGVGAYFERYGAVWTGGADAPPAAATPAPTDEQGRRLLQLKQDADAGWQERSVHTAWGAGVQRLAERLRLLHARGELTTPIDGSVSVGERMCRHAVLGIVGSHIHMLNNRLGIPPMGETLLARMLGGAVHSLKRQGATT